jgi:excisionase family DNA binding protein
MSTIEQIKKPSKSDQKIAFESYNALSAIIDQINTDDTEIEIDETKEKIKMPLYALRMLNDILKLMSEGKPISMIPIATEVTTQKAAEILGCSRPHLVKLLEDGDIAYNKVGKHRRVRFEDIMNYKKKMKENQKKHIIDIMNLDEETGLYDS